MKGTEQFEQAYGLRITQTRRLQILGLLLCGEIVLAFSYLGYISIPPISVTTMHILVIVAGMFFGPADAVAVAAIFAVTSIWKASVTSTEPGDIIFSPFLSGNPAGSLVMSTGARLLFAAATGWAFRVFFSKKPRARVAGIAAISILATALHSLLVYAAMDIFFGVSSTETADSFKNTMVVNNLVLYAVTLTVVLLMDRFMRGRMMNSYFTIVGDRTARLDSGKRRIVVTVFLAMTAVCVFICLHLASRVNVYIANYGPQTDDTYMKWVGALIAQFICGFAGAFGMITIVIIMIQQYLSALAIQEIQKAQQAAEEANRSKTSFLFNMSHDIRTPMNAITGYTAMALKYSDSDRVTDCLRKIETSGQQLLALVNQVLEMSRIESGKLTLQESPIDVAESVEAMLTVLRADAELKGLRLICSVSELAHRRVITDVTRLNQILVNILSNAVKYTPEGGAVSIFVKEQESGTPGTGLYTFAVRDNGIGMSEEYLERIFDEFTRENTSTVSQIQGTGLGMSIVKRLVELMDGTIDIKSTRGKGTEVTVVLPLKADTSQVEPEARPVHGKNRNVSIAGMKILLVDDNEMNREIARDILEDYGAVVTEKEDGDEAVAAVKKSAPGDFDLVLMDIQMPRMDGYEATRAIRELENSALAGIPIVAMTANAFEEDRRNALNAGMDGHLTKPINIPRLIETLYSLK